MNDELPTQVHVSLPFAGFWLRAGAFVLDALVLSVVTRAAAFVLAAALGMPSHSFYYGYGPNFNYGPYYVDYHMTGVPFLVAMAYQAFFLSGKWQATPGKRICGIYVMRDIGGAISPIRAAARFFCYFISIMFCGIGFLMVGFTREKTGLHDLICETRVVMGKK